MPMRFWVKVGITCPWRTVCCGSGMVHDDTDVCVCTVAGLTSMGGIFLLQFL